MEQNISQLADRLSTRYGRLALARAAGEANAARAAGDQEKSALLYGVISHLRQAMTGCEMPEMA